MSNFNPYKREIKNVEGLLSGAGSALDEHERSKLPEHLPKNHEGCSKALGQLAQYLGQLVDQNWNLKGGSKKLLSLFTPHLNDVAYDFHKAGGKNTSEEWNIFGESMKPEFEKTFQSCVQLLDEADGGELFLMYFESEINKPLEAFMAK